jgi:cytidine deaminase
MEEENLMLTDELRAQLIETATTSRERAYTPYSHYEVGAALLTATGKIYSGVNIENAAYPVTMCAERVSVFKAISEGERDFEAMAVVTANGGFPCGSCRQVLAEFGLDTLIIVADGHGKIIREITVRELLPEAFVPQYLFGDY